MRVFFDASIIIAALLSETEGSAQLFKFIKAGTITVITSQTVIEEILEEDKPKKLKRSKEQLIGFVQKSQLIIRRSVTSAEIEPYKNLIDTEDAHLVAGANLTKCKYLVSLDKKHVIRSDIEKRFLPLKIVSPKELLEEIVK